MSSSLRLEHQPYPSKWGNLLSFMGVMDEGASFGVLDFEEAIAKDPKPVKWGAFLGVVKEARREQRKTCKYCRYLHVKMRYKKMEECRQIKEQTESIMEHMQQICVKSGGYPNIENCKRWAMGSM